MPPKVLGHHFAFVHRLLRSAVYICFLVATYSSVGHATLCKAVFFQPKISPDSTIYEILFQLQVASIEDGDRLRTFDCGSFYRQAFTVFPNTGLQLRASKEERRSNALNIKVDRQKFNNLTARELRQQWGASELNIPLDKKHSSWSRLSGLRRGDQIKLSRRIVLSQEDLDEFLSTGVVVNRILHLLNYDGQKEVHLLERFGLNDDLEKLIKANASHGGFAISTSYASTGWGHLPQNLGSRFIMRLLDHGAEKFVLLILFDVPAEALVISGPDGQIPEHVKRNPKGFGIIDSNGAEQEVTFIGVIPPEWIANMGEIKRDYERILSIP